MTGALHHVCISVSELEPAVAWYTAALGFEPEFTFAAGALRGTMLVNGEGDRVELFERVGSRPGVAWADPLTALETRGCAHFALRVADLERSYAQLLAAGAEGVWEPTASPQPGVRMAFVHDLEGNLIELVEVRPAAESASRS